MRIVKRVKFHRLELQILKKCSRWVDYAEDHLHFTEEEEKTLRWSDGRGDYTKTALAKVINVWLKVRGIAQKEVKEFSDIKERVPERAEGLMMRPKLVAESIVQARKQAVYDINRLLIVVRTAYEQLQNCPDVEFDAYEWEPTDDPFDDDINFEAVSDIESPDDLIIAT